MKLIINCKDDMSPIERAKAIMSGKDYDRVPFDPYLGEIKARYIGKSIKNYWLDEENLVSAEIEAFNKYGIDGMCIGPNAIGISEAIGAEICYPENGRPYVKSSAIKNIKDVKYLDVINEKSKGIEKYYNATSRIRNIGDNICPVSVSLSGPLTLASFILGSENFLKSTIKQPEDAYILLSYIFECIKFIVDKFSALDVSFSIADPMASNTVISPRVYKKFAFPFTQKICEYVEKRSGKLPSYHVCGNTKKSWELIKELRIGVFSIDNEIDIFEACNEFSNTHIIAGNVDPLNIICKGSKESIDFAVKQSLMAGKTCGKGFILTPGCNLPLETKDENIEFFLDAGRKHSYIIKNRY